MTTAWRTLEISSSAQKATADAVPISPSCLNVSGSRRLPESLLSSLKRVGFAASLGESFDLVPTESSATRLLALGTGTDSTMPQDHWLSLGGFLLEAMRSHRLETVRLPDSTRLGGADVLEPILLGALLHGFELEKAGQIKGKTFVPRGLLVADGDSGCIDVACRVATAVNRTRAWVEQPANLLTPRIWVEEAREIFTRYKARVRVFGPQELENMGARALLAVGRGSEDGAHLLAVEWRGDATRTSWDAVMVGKGLTFDSGGLNLKPRPNVNKMKLDMAGGAAVLGALELAIQRGSPSNLVAIVPIAENAIDAHAFRPGDVVISLSGLTIEVADTDAEGRLVLADAITYALREYRPASLIDLATLTTAVTGVLHEEFAGLYASHDDLAQGLLRAGEAVGERLWRLPLEVSQDYLVDSEVADLSNIGAPGFFGKGDGSPTAGAKFLEKFARGVNWAHIDICGTAWSTRRTPRGGKGATGYGARLLDRWLLGIEGRKT